MHHSGAVRFLESIGNLDGDGQHQLGSERPLAQPFGQRLALQELPDKVVDGAFVAHVMEHTDMRMLKLRDDLGFTFEARAQLRAGHQLRVQIL